ncbi:zinc finger, CCHC-type containing protein [Tanacetum coccineum]|uniref:Zinc finger, CCHC-type containing protein n=1 Tax=Tanacetum coccineum TaxID=301880 RepID=A0ABQ5CUC9_9ASTR
MTTYAGDTIEWTGHGTVPMNSLGILGHTTHGLKMDESISVSSIIDKLPPSWKDFKHTLKHGKDDCLWSNLVDAIAWWIDSGATTHVCKDRCWFKTFEPVEDGSVLYMGDEHFAPIHGKGSVALEFSSRKIITLFNVLYVPKLRFDYYNNGNKKYVITFIDDASRFCYVYLLHAKDEALDKFRIYKTEVELQQNDLVKTLRTDRGGEYYDPVFFQSVGIIHETTAPYTPQQQTWCFTVSEKENFGFEKGIDCIFVDIAEHSKHIEIPEPQKGKRVQKAKSYGSDFQLCLVEGSIDQKEAIDDEIGSIMENNTWILSNLPPGCKWIFKRKMKVDGIIDKFKARLVIQGFRQKEGIYYFDTYAPVARITTIRLLLALAAIHNLVIHQMDVETTFLNGDLDEEVYMKQPEGFVMPGNEHKVCKLVKSLYGLKQAPKQWHQKFDEVVLSSGFHLNQSDKCVYSKFDNSGKGVIICLYVDDMLIFGTDQNQVDKTKKFLSSKFSMKDMGETDVILDCYPVSTPMNPVEKLKPNTGKPVDQLEYSRAIGCLMYAMTSTRPDIAYVVGRLNSSSMSGWVFLLGGGAISWASKKQTCITGSTMESEFVALAAASKEAEWLRNLIYEISIWPKPIAPISIRCDSEPTMSRAYSQIYNGKSRHLGIRHSMVRELIRNGVITIEFVRTQRNLVDHLTKGLARDLVNKSVKGMGLKSKQIYYL